MTHLKFKRHYRLPLLLILVAAVLIVGPGDQRIIAYSVQDIEQVAGPVLTYGHRMEALFGSAAESIWVTGTVRAAGEAGSQ